MFAHYFDVKSTGGVNGSPHPTGQFRTAAAAVDFLHLENARLSGLGEPRLAVAFPSLLSGGRDVMGTVRVFGRKDQTDAFRTLLNTRMSEEHPGVMKVSGVQEVPKSHTLATYRRDRSGEKEVGGYADRALQRAQRKAMERIARGETVEKPPISSIQRAELMNARGTASIGSLRAHLRLVSRSTRQGFSLFVTASRGVNGGPSGELDVYGLSRRENPVAVPHF